MVKDASLLKNRVLDLSKLLLSGRLFKEISEVKSRIKNCLQAQKEVFLPKKEQNVRVSVVIPTLNESEYICNPLQSLKAGQYSNFEVVLVDCMSDDDTVEKARKFGTRIVSSKIRNVGHQTHLGFLSAKGDIIIRTDADTIFPKDVLAKTVEAFTDKKIMIYGVGHLYYDSGILLNVMAHLYDKYWRKTWTTAGPFIAVRRETYEKVAFKSLPEHQDTDFGKRAYQIFGSEAFLFDPNTVVLISSRTIRKMGLLNYILYGGSFKERPKKPRIPLARKLGT